MFLSKNEVSENCRYKLARQSSIHETMDGLEPVVVRQVSGTASLRTVTLTAHTRKAAFLIRKPREMLLVYRSDG